jgi:hypothetical protein
VVLQYGQRRAVGEGPHPHVLVLAAGGDGSAVQRSTETLQRSSGSCPRPPYSTPCRRCYHRRSSGKPTRAACTARRSRAPGRTTSRTSRTDPCRSPVAVRLTGRRSVRGARECDRAATRTRWSCVVGESATRNVLALTVRHKRSGATRARVTMATRWKSIPRSSPTSPIPKNHWLALKRSAKALSVRYPPRAEATYGAVSAWRFAGKPDDGTGSPVGVSLARCGAERTVCELDENARSANGEQRAGRSRAVHQERVRIPRVSRLAIRTDYCASGP